MAMIVEGNAAKNKFRADTLPSGKCSLKIDRPAGLGALAITVRPPPVMAPATKAVSYTHLTLPTTSRV